MCVWNDLKSELCGMTLSLRCVCVCVTSLSLNCVSVWNDLKSQLCLSVWNDLKSELCVCGMTLSLSSVCLCGTTLSLNCGSVCVFRTLSRTRTGTTPNLSSSSAASLSARWGEGNQTYLSTSKYELLVYLSHRL